MKPGLSLAQTRAKKVILNPLLSFLFPTLRNYGQGPCVLVNVDRHVQVVSTVIVRNLQLENRRLWCAFSE